MIGRHKRAGIRRRRGKAIVLIGLLIVILASASLTISNREPEEPAKPMSPTWLAYMRNTAKYSPALAKIYCQQYPEYAAQIMDFD